MYAIITAGGTPAANDPLFALTKGSPKALLPIAGKPMIQWVLDALSGTELIDQVIVTGMQPDAAVTCRHSLAILPDHGGMIENIRAGIDEILENNPSAAFALIISSDIPAIQPAMLEWVIKNVEQTDADLFYNVISRRVMETTFPSSRRTYLHLKDLEVCGGDLNAIRLSFLKEDKPLFHEIIDSRKNPLKQASLFGFDVLFGLLLKRLSLQDLEKKLSERLQARGRALDCPFAEIGMDVDKPFQFEIIESYLKTQFSQ